MALINTNYALEAKLDPAKDALFIESGQNSPYANFIAARKDNAASPAVKKLVRVDAVLLVDRLTVQQFPLSVVLSAVCN